MILSANLKEAATIDLDLLLFTHETDRTYCGLAHSSFLQYITSEEIILQELRIAQELA